jgi:Sigma-70, region 4
MAILDSLPPDQRAVLELVLKRGRTYDDVARLASIDRAAVRERALAAFDALGPQTRVPPGRRALITDYLLGQLPKRVSEDTRDHLAESSSERAWARVLASELTSIARQPLPEIPVESRARAARQRVGNGGAPAAGVAVPAGELAPPRVRRERVRPAPARPPSRVGGAVLLAVVGLAVLAAAIVAIATSGSSSKHPTASTAAATSGAPSSSTPTSASSSGVTPLAQVNLNPPTGATGSAKGIAFVLKRGSATAIAIQAQNIPANTNHNAYAVWLYSSATDSHILGFVNPGVGTNGVLQTAGPLPANAGHYKQVLVTLETQANPHAPGQIVLQGTLTGLP